MFYTVHWTQSDVPAEMDFPDYHSAKSFFDCLQSACRPYMSAETHLGEPVQLYQVHVYRRGTYCGMSAWCALRPTRGRTAPASRPYLYTKDEAEHKIKELVTQGEDPKNTRMVRV